MCGVPVLIWLWWCYSVEFEQYVCVCVCVFLMKRQFVVTHTILQTEISALLDSWVTNTPVKMLCPQKNLLSFHFHKNGTCLSVGLLMIAQVFSVSCKIVCCWVLTYCCFMNNICSSHTQYGVWTLHCTMSFLHIR